MTTPKSDLADLKPGDKHYQAFVGRPEQYDFMGASQFRLLCTLGLRSKHYLLDFGCGSLRAGRFLISYLDRGHYFGVEPEKWLIDDAVEHQVGQDFLRLKQPKFDHNKNFLCDVFRRRFDYILCQSIFSHTGRDFLEKIFNGFRDALEPDGLIAATFKEGKFDHSGNGWVYPECVTYRPSKISEVARGMGLLSLRIPWFHPTQSWYVFSRNPNRIPTVSMLRHLSGEVLFAPELNHPGRKAPNFLNTWWEKGKLFARGFLNSLGKS